MCIFLDNVAWGREGYVLEMILEKAKRADPRDLSIVKGRNISWGGFPLSWENGVSFFACFIGFIVCFKCLNVLIFSDRVFLLWEFHGILSGMSERVELKCTSWNCRGLQKVKKKLGM